MVIFTRTTAALINAIARQFGFADTHLDTDSGRPWYSFGIERIDLGNLRSDGDVWGFGLLVQVSLLTITQNGPSAIV